MNPTSSQVFEIRNESGKLIAVFRPKIKLAFSNKKADKIVLHKDICARWTKKSNPEFKSNHHAEINLTKQTIRIYGVYNKTEFDRTFKVGDEIEYDSYNFNYTNPILKIMPAGVKVTGHGGAKHMNLESFIWRNWDLDLEKIAKNNLETSYCI